MTTDEFIQFLTARFNSGEEKTTLAEGMPLGVDDNGEMVFARKQGRVFNVRNTCVTGGRKTPFIKRLLLTLSQLYTREEANFFIVSPYKEYGELLQLKNADFTIPYVYDKAQLVAVRECLEKLVDLYKNQKRCLKLFLVLDGLDELKDCNLSSSLEEYREIFDIVANQSNVEVISGAELMKSIFSGYPGAFVGVGNALITTIEEGKADVTYVGEDSSLSMPTPIRFPTAPSVTETVIMLNALSQRRTSQD